MAAKCEFAAEQLNERVRDQFVACTDSDRIRDRLLQVPAAWTLNELEALALTVERAMTEAPALSSSAQPLQAAVGQVGGRHSRASGCWNCGHPGHTS